MICTVIHSPTPSFSMLCPVNRKGKHEIERKISPVETYHISIRWQVHCVVEAMESVVFM